MMDALRALGAKGHPIAASVVLPLVQGTAAFAAGDHASALRHFEPVEAEMHRIGGSHAQWEIYEETMVQCYLALERYDDAVRLVRRRLARRASPRDLGMARAREQPAVNTARDKREVIIGICCGEQARCVRTGRAKTDSRGSS